LKQTALNVVKITLLKSGNPSPSNFFQVVLHAALQAAMSRKFFYFSWLFAPDGALAPVLKKILPPFNRLFKHNFFTNLAFFLRSWYNFSYHLKKFLLPLGQPF